MTVEEFKNKCEILMEYEDFDYVFSKIRDESIKPYINLNICNNLSRIINTISWRSYDYDRLRNLCDEYLDLNTLVTFEHLKEEGVSLFHKIT
jgi:hypothetical protein